MHDYSLAELVDVIGAPRRAVQHWIANGVIQALPATEKKGTGKHRRFDRDEVIIGCLVHGFVRGMQQPIGVLLRISAMLRDHARHPKLRQMIGRAIAGEKVYVILRGSGAPDFVIALGDGSTQIEFDIGFYDSTLGTPEELASLMHTFILGSLDSFGGFALTIGAHTHLVGLRK